MHEHAEFSDAAVVEMQDLGGGRAREKRPSPTTTTHTTSFRVLALRERPVTYARSSLVALVLRARFCLRRAYFGELPTE
jgi:hypothetical protein